MQGASGTAGGQHVLRGQPFTGLKMHIGSGSSASKGANQQQPRTSTSSVGSSSGKVPGSPAAGSPAGVQLHVGALSVLDDLLAGAQYSQAAYGYVAAAGHLSNLGNAIKMLATLPHFNAITGELGRALNGCATLLLRSLFLGINVQVNMGVCKLSSLTVLRASCAGALGTPGARKGPGHLLQGAE
jgi:hypothetical protein